MNLIADRTMIKFVTAALRQKAKKPLRNSTK